MLPHNQSSAERFRVIFVCSGNICRSPMAETVFHHQVSAAGLADKIEVSSAGTGDWHVGERPDRRALTALRKREYPPLGKRSRQFDPEWFGALDLVIAMDRTHERTLRDWARNDADASTIATLLSFDPAQAAELDVPDPYYADDAEFDRVLGMIEQASAQLLRQITPAIH